MVDEFLRQFTSFPFSLFTIHLNHTFASEIAASFRVHLTEAHSPVRICLAHVFILKLNAILS